MLKQVTIAAALLTVLGGCASNESNNPSGSATTSGTAASGENMTTQLKTADGTTVADATIDFANGYATVTVETVKSGVLSPGFHGLHIHKVGRCEPNSVAPTGGAAGDFNSAGGHYQVPGHTGHPASGDLTSLEVRSDGSAKLVTTTDAFTAADLKGAEGSALMIHEGPDNFANIPPRYTENGAGGADTETLATGDAGKRLACGVLSPASASSASTSTSTSVSTSTSTVTEIPPSAAPTTTESSTPPPTTTSSSAGTTPSASTTTPPEPTTTTVPASPGG